VELGGAKLREWLINRRNELDLTQAEVAQEANIKRSTYSMIELGERNASVSNAKKIANALGFDWTIFFDDECHETCNFENSIDVS